jgi:hypothetical protein
MTRHDPSATLAPLHSGRSKAVKRTIGDLLEDGFRFAHHDVSKKGTRRWCSMALMWEQGKGCRVSEASAGGKVVSLASSYCVERKGCCQATAIQALRIVARAVLLAAGWLCAARADPALHTLSYGVNINESLINPLESGKSAEDLTRQIAGILHTVRMDGGRTVRWFVTQAWPQYRCSRDPEDQATGELDPAWYLISKTLLQQAQRVTSRDKWDSLSRAV